MKYEVTVAKTSIGVFLHYKEALNAYTDVKREKGVELLKFQGSTKFRIKWR